jgi:hypothetical protein
VGGTTRRADLEPITAVTAWGDIDQHHLEPDRHATCDLPGAALLEAAKGASTRVVGAGGLGAEVCCWAR